MWHTATTMESWKTGVIREPIALRPAFACGGWAVDRGSGSGPAFLAHGLAAAQALGWVLVERRADELRAERRLDRGRREVVRLLTPAVVSVEAGAAVLRRTH